MILKGFKTNHIKGNTLTQYDNEMIVIAKTKLDRSFEKEFTIDNKALETILKIGKLEQIDFVDDKKIRINKGGKQYTTNLIENPNFELNMGNQIYVGKYKLDHLLKASKCVSTNESQTNYKGVMFDKNQNVYGVDNFRVYFNSIDNNRNFDKPCFSVSTSFIKQLTNISNKNVNNICLQFTNTYVGTELDDNTSIFSRLFNFNCPDLKPIIETPLNKKIIFKCNEDLNILTTTLVTIENDNLKKTITFTFQDDINKFACKFESSGDDFKVINCFNFIKDFIKLNNEENVIEANDNGLMKLNGRFMIAPIRGI